RRDDRQPDGRRPHRKQRCRAPIRGGRPGRARRLPGGGDNDRRRSADPAARHRRALQSGADRRHGHRKTAGHGAPGPQWSVARNRTMNFCSDNVTGAAPEIMTALAAANAGPAMGYGNDDITRRVEKLIGQLFETDVAVFPVATGTAANALALSVMAPSYGAVYCHESAHINVDECGAPELFTGGAKLVDLPGANGKLDAALILDELGKGMQGNVHNAQPAVVSLTQATEFGTIYK